MRNGIYTTDIYGPRMWEHMVKQLRAVSGDFLSLDITHSFYQAHITAFLYPFFHDVHLSLYSPILSILSDIITTVLITQCRAAVNQVTTVPQPSQPQTSKHPLTFWPSQSLTIVPDMSQLRLQCRPSQNYVYCLSLLGPKPINN